MFLTFQGTLPSVWMLLKSGEIKAAQCPESSQALLLSVFPRAGSNLLQNLFLTSTASKQTRVIPRAWIWPDCQTEANIPIKPQPELASSPREGVQAHTRRWEGSQKEAGKFRASLCPLHRNTALSWDMVNWFQFHLLVPSQTCLPAFQKTPLIGRWDLKKS